MAALFVQMFEEFTSILNNISPLSLALERLLDGYPALTPAAGGRLAEAASVSLEEHKHLNPVSLTVRGLFTLECALEFFHISEQLKRT